jgi:hypothetical protein
MQSDHFYYIAWLDEPIALGLEQYTGLETVREVLRTQFTSAIEDFNRRVLFITIPALNGASLTTHF